MTRGSVASIETMGLVDGPGIRTIVFLNGCKLRCKYCHNPEMQKMGDLSITPSELCEKIIRNKLKISTSINNSKIFKNIQKEYGTFHNYINSFTKNEIFYEIDKTTSKLSDDISNDLKKRGMKFVGSTIIYSYLQAIGVIYSHDRNCFLYKKN